jgi:hypothetical protein
MCLLSMHMKLAPIYIHKAGSMCFVPDITSAFPQVVSMQFFKCLSILCWDFFDTELEIFASMINVWFGGSLLLVILGCVVFMCFWNNAFCMELCSLFIGHA